MEDYNMTKQLGSYSPSMRRTIRHKLDKHRSLQKFSTTAYQKYCSLTGWLHVLPDYMIIGFAKCGTTSLHEYLIQHPLIYPPLGKEIDYFDRLYSRGINWYRAKFPLKTQKFFVKNILKKEFVTGEATPRYLEHPNALMRIKKILPNEKFIVLVRNPIDRAFSHYNMNLRNGYEYRSFEDAIKHEEERISGRYEKMNKNTNYYSWDYDLFAYREHGVYIKKLKKWLEVFPREQFLIIQSEEFLEKPHTVYHKTLNFLNLPKWEPVGYQFFKKREYKEKKIDPEFRKNLQNYFEPYNEELYKLLDENFRWD